MCLFLKNWRFDVLGRVNQTNVQLLNEVEKFAFRNASIFKSFDSFTAASFLFPALVIEEKKRYNVTVELQGYLTRGQTIVNHLSHDFNANIIQKISETDYKRIMMWTANYD